MINIVLVSVVLVLLVEAWKWYHFFLLDELPEFNRSGRACKHTKKGWGKIQF